MNECPTCVEQKTNGRDANGPIHCRDCHQTWTGNEAQHCVVIGCHRTFSAISAADAHRYRRLPDKRLEDRCIDPSVTEGWREIRPGVWTNGAVWSGMPGSPPTKAESAAQSVEADG